MASSSDSRFSISSGQPAQAPVRTASGSPGGFDTWTDVEVHADPGLDVIAVVLDGTQQLLWHPDVAQVALALASASDTPQWCPRHSMLLVPGGFQSSAGSSFFCLAALERPHRCSGRAVPTEAGAAAPQPT